jgi:hypothetical protein
MLLLADESGAGKGIKRVYEAGACVSRAWWSQDDSRSGHPTARLGRLIVLPAVYRRKLHAWRGAANTMGW